MSSSGLIGSSTAAAYSLPASSLSSAAMLSASLSALPSSIGAGHSLSSMFSQALNARSASGNGNSNASSAGQNVMNYLSANVNYAAINPNSLNNSSSSSPSTGMTPLPAPSPASYLYPPYSHSHDPSPNSGTPYPIPVPSYPYGNVNVYYPPGGTANSNVNVNVNAYPNTPLMYTNVQNRSAALGSMHNSGSSNNIRSMQSFDPIPSAFDGNPASSSASAAFQSIARSQTNLGVALSQQQQQRRAHELYTNFNESLNEAQPAQPQSQSAPFYPAAGSGMPTPSPLQTNSSAAAAYHMNHRMTGGASAMQQLAPPTDNSSSNFDAYAQTSFPYRVTLPLAMQPAPPRMHSPQQLGMHPQTPSTAYLQSSGGMTEDMRSRKRKPATDASDTSTSDNTPADHSTSPNSPSVSASPFILAHVASHPHSHTAAALHPQLHQSLLSQAHAQRATHSLLHSHTHPHAHATFHGHQPLPAAVVHPLAHAGMYSASHPSFMSAIPAMGGGSPGVEVLSSSSVAVLSELTDEQLEQEAKFVLGDRQCELMTVMLREVGAWHRRQYWAGKLKESNDGAWRDFLNIARNRSLDLQTLEHHWQSRVCNPFDGHNMDKFNRRLAYLGLQVEWRRGTQKSEYRIIRIARMMPVEGNKSHHAEAPMQGLVGAHAQGKKLNYRSAMWYKRAKRNSDADESAEEDAKVKSAAGATAPSRGADSDSQEDSNDEEVMAIQQQSRQAATVAVAAAAVAGAPTTAISSSDQSQSQSVPLSNSTVSIEVSLDPNRSGQQNKSSGGVLTEFSSSEDDEAEEEQSENVWSPQSASAISSSSSIESFSDLVDWSITEMSDFLFDLMKSHVRPDSHSSDWHSPADWSLLLKRQNVALWNHFVQRCRSRGCAVSMLNRTWRQAFRRPFLYDNLVQWNTRLAHLADPFLIEARSDLQTQRQQFRIAAMQKTAPQATQKSMMIDNGDESKMNQQKAHSSAAENSQFGGDRSAPSPFDSSALDSQKPMDTITIHHPIHVHTNPNPNAFAHQHIAAELFHMTANGNSSSSPSSSSPSASTSTALASFVPHAACVSAVARLSSTPTDMHVATSSAAITSESRASAAKLFVF